jgi:hypothetical protein
MTKQQAAQAIEFDLDDLAGPGHPQTVDMGNKLSREGLARSKAQEMARVNGKKWKGDDETAEEVLRRTAQTFAGRILGWTPVKFDGEDYPFTTENAVKLLMDPSRGDTLVTQLAEFIGDEKAFMKRSENS